MQDDADPPWLQLLYPLQQGWRAKEIGREPDPDPHIEAELGRRARGRRYLRRLATPDSQQHSQAWPSAA